MTRSTLAAVGEVMGRLLAAMNAHDVDAFVACFAPDYRSEQPAHPSRAFGGSAQVRDNWTSVFAGVPDFHADLLVAVTTDDGIEASQIAWGRLYMEPVEQDGSDIEQMVRDTYRPST